MSERTDPTDQALAAFADAVLLLARRLDIRGPELRDIVPLTGTEIAVIRAVQHRPGSTPSAIADATGLRRSNVSTAIHALEAGGLITREHRPDNARSVTIALTPLALENLARLAEHWAEILHALPPDLLGEAAGAAATLQRIAEALAAADGVDPD